MHIVCTDLEGVLIPEVWIAVAEKTGIPELRLTTRDIADYDQLMRQRLRILKENRLTLRDIQDVITTMEPLDGALDFLDKLRETTQVIIVSDTYIEFARPFMKKLGWPTLFCHDLTTDESGTIVGYNLRQKDAKKHTVRALKSLNYDVIAMGDSYNDTAMLIEADHGILFRPPASVVEAFPQFPVCTDYETLFSLIASFL